MARIEKSKKMKNVTLILTTILLSFTANAQQFGVMAEVGKSNISGIEKPDAASYNPKISYGFGITYQIPFSVKENFDIRFSMYYNKIRYQYLFSSSNSIFRIGNNYVILQDYTYSANNITLEAMPIYKGIKIVKIGIGVNYSYLTSLMVNRLDQTYYEDGNGNIVDMIVDKNSTSDVTSGNFLERSFFGVKLLLGFQINKYLNIGGSYRFSSRIKAPVNEHKVNFDILSLTTHITFD